MRMLAVTLLVLSAGFASTAAADSNWSWGDSSKWTRSDYAQGWQSYSNSSRHWAKKWKKAKRKYNRRNSRFSDRLNELRWSNVNSGVCDELKGSRRGLRMLCIAFCELQTCTPDFTLDNPLQNCSTSSKWLHARYEKRRGAGDPEMPCIKAPEENIAACPCWTDEELSALRSVDTAENVLTDCYTDQGNGTSVVNMDFWRIWGDPNGASAHRTTVGASEFELDRNSATCFIQDTCADGNCSGVNRYLDVTAEQASTCQAALLIAGSDRGLACPQ